MADIDVSQLALGKLGAATDTKTFRMAQFLNTEELPAPPKRLHLERTVTPAPTFPMHGNDRYGDCTCAAAAHMVELWTAQRDKEILLTDKQVLDAYWAITGGHDTGAVMLNVLNYWRQNGIGGHSLYAFAKADTDYEMKQSVAMFGGSYIGIGLPLTAQAQTGPSQVWKLVSDYRTNPKAVAWSWGGHAVNVIGYDSSYVYVVTWGFIQKMTWGFLHHYCDERWAALTNDWANATVRGFNFQALRNALARI